MTRRILKLPGTSVFLHGPPSRWGMCTSRHHPPSAWRDLLPQWRWKGPAIGGIWVLLLSLNTTLAEFELRRPGGVELRSPLQEIVPLCCTTHGSMSGQADVDDPQVPRSPRGGFQNRFQGVNLPICSKMCKTHPLRVKLDGCSRHITQA